MRTPMQLGGDAAEDVVAERLVAIGWSIVGRKVHAGRGELDIVAIDPGPPRILVIVEVRARRRRDFGLPEETVDHRKRARLHAAAWRWLDTSDHGGLAVRFDLIVVEPDAIGSQPRIRHYRAAF